MDRRSIIDDIKSRIIARLKEELPDTLLYHVPEHTIDVYEKVRFLGTEEGVSEEDIQLLEIAALYHDVGFIERYDNNEEIGARIAGEELPELGFNQEEINTIKNIIMATKMPHNPNTLLEKIICDADLDNLGREDFYIQTELLRLELAKNGINVSPRQWYAINLPKLFEMHQYFTETAKRLRNPLKEKHLDEILELVGEK
ncbi:MAG: hypothetical protein Kow00108_01220 [Calditrichia bacterium]